MPPDKTVAFKFVVDGKPADQRVFLWLTKNRKKSWSNGTYT